MSEEIVNPTWFLHMQDSVQWLESISSETVDLVLSDPPYESLEKHRSRGTTTRLKKSKGSSNEWFSIFRNERFPAFFSQVYRVLRPNTHFYLFSDAETMFVVKPLAENVGFKLWTPLVWKKGKKIGMGYHYRSQYEFVLFFEKGKRRLADLSISNVLDFSPVWRKYPTEKPVNLLRLLIRQSSKPGDLVIDPFAGSASTLEAAYLEGRNSIGCDISTSAIEYGQNRMMQVTNRLVGEEADLCVRSTS